MKLVILDRDGTINHDSDQYIKSPEEWKPIKGSLEAIARLTQADYRIVVATNQSGIARGLFDTRTLIAIHDTLHARARAGRRAHRRVLLLPARGRSRTASAASPQPGMLLESRRGASTWRSTSVPHGRRRAARPRGRGGGRREAGAGAHRQGHARRATQAACRRARESSPTSPRSPRISHREDRAVTVLRSALFCARPDAGHAALRAARAAHAFRCRAWRATASSPAGRAWSFCACPAILRHRLARRGARAPAARPVGDPLQAPVGLGDDGVPADLPAAGAWCSSASCCGSRSSAGASR